MRDAFPVNQNNSIVPPTTTTSSSLASSVVSAPVVFSSSQLPASVGTSDISHGCNSQVSLLTSNSANISLPLLPATGSTSFVQPPSKVVPIYGNQLPPIPRFTGEEDSTESGTFCDWLEQFEAVATLAGWDEHAKLVNLTTRLRGTAYSFYRSCASEQRSNYKLLVEQLRKRFTPVELTAIQSQCFHDRHQTAKESVDEFAQELKKLFHKAYSNLTRGGVEAEAMGQSVLANQFVSGLRPELKSKVVGFEGNFEQLLVKARFEEAKLRDLAQPRNGQRGGYIPQQQRTPNNFRTNATGNRSTRQQDPIERCYTCNKPGHFARNCPLKGRGAPVESKGKYPAFSGQRNSSRETTTANLQEESATSLSEAQDEVAELCRKLQLAEMRESLTKAAVTTNVLQKDNTEYSLAENGDSPSLGPTLTAEVCVEGQPTKALLDTGSPISIISIEFLLQALLNLNKEKPKEERLKFAESKLKTPTISIRNFGGGRVNVLSQVTVDINRGSYQCRATILVQKGSTIELLLGTDLLTKLGFDLVKTSQEGKLTSLLSNFEYTQSEKKSERKDLLTPSPVRLPPESKTSGDREGKLLEVDNHYVTVKLLQAVKIPARHSKLVRAQAKNSEVNHPVLFEEKKGENKNLSMTMCVTEVDKDKKLVVAIENYGLQPVVLEEGFEIGHLEPIQLISEGTETCTLAAAEAEQTGQDFPEVNHRSDELLSQLDLEVSLTEEEKGKLRNLVEFNVFAKDLSELGRTNVVQHAIDTGTHPPIKQLPHRTPFSLRKRTEELIESMLKQGVITNSNSPWASPIVLVAKKDGSTRFCVDYRKLNAITKLDSFPLPRVDDSLDLLANTAYFSSLDLASGYWQVGMAPDSQQKTAFCSHLGHYEFTVMPFGLCNAPATFQRLMETVLAGLARERCIVYLDDILVIGTTFEEHLRNLSEVFERLRQFGLRLKPSKCHLAKRQVTYLGYNVSEGGISADSNKVDAVKRFPTPNDVGSLRSFLGLASYYRRFVPGFSKVAEPLFSLTRKDVTFKWSEICDNAFQKLKTLLTSAPLLIFPNFQKEFILETDASISGLGAVLAQQTDAGHVSPIAFASRTLQKHEKNYCSSELEALAVVWAVKHFRPYLYGHTCQLYTDHKALKSLMNTPHPSGKLARWGLAIQELDLHIHHRSGKTNQAADALSRLRLLDQDSDKESRTGHPVVQAKDGEGLISQIEAENGVTTDSSLNTLAECQDNDPELKLLKDYMLTGQLPEDERKARELVLSKTQFEIKDGVLYHLERDKTLRIVPPSDSRKELFDDVHNGIFGAHLRSAKIHSQLAQHYWWPTMRADIDSWARACRVCASRNIGKPLHPSLVPLPVGGPFDRVGVDVVQLPTSQKGNKYAVVFIDYLTKWPEVYPTRNQSSLTIAKLLVEHIIPQHGVPSQLLSDRGPAFLSKIMFELYKLLGIKKVCTTAYHPQTDGLVERYIRTLVDMLSKKVEQSGKDWDKQLPYVLFAYRTSSQESTKASPFFLLYGRNPKLPTTAALNPPVDRVTLNLADYQTEVAIRMSNAWESAKAAIKRAQKQQKTQYDKRAKDPNVSVGDTVFVYFPAKKSGRAYKFARPFQGPYLVKQVDVLPSKNQALCQLNYCK